MNFNSLLLLNMASFVFLTGLWFLEHAIDGGYGGKTRRTAILGTTLCVIWLVAYVTYIQP